MSAERTSSRALTFLRRERSANLLLSARGALLALIASALLALGAAGCGGSGSSTSTSTPTTATEAPAAKPTPAQIRAETAADRRAAGRAASFVKPRTDNSVPTFGAEAGASQRSHAEAALSAYLEARARADWPSACRYLSASTRKGLEKLAASSSKAKLSGCAPVLAALSKGADLSDPLTDSLLSLRVESRNAFALFYGSGHQQYIMPMSHEAAGWRLTQTAPIAYPPAVSEVPSQGKTP